MTAISVSPDLDLRRTTPPAALITFTSATSRIFVATIAPSSAETFGAAESPAGYIHWQFSGESRRGRGLLTMPRRATRCRRESCAHLERADHLDRAAPNRCSACLE